MSTNIIFYYSFNKKELVKSIANIFNQREQLNRNMSTNKSRLKHMKIYSLTQ